MNPEVYLSSERTVFHYRNLHRIPEASGEEYETSAYIVEALGKAGYKPQKAGGTNVYADLVVDPSYTWLLLRADMDALPVEENSCATTKSEHPGWMHACGHDSHCAMLLTAAEMLRGEKLSHNIRFLFQSAEEVTQGAMQAIEHGVLPENLLACFAMHVWPGVPEGSLVTRPGPLMASSDVYRIRIHGRSAHCAQSHKGADALQTAVLVASKMPELKAKAESETVLFCGSIHSGHTHNVVPDEAELYGTLRTYTEVDRELLKSGLVALAHEAASKFGTQAELIWDGGCPAVTNDATVIEKLQTLICDLSDSAEATFAGEDFAYFQQHAPGVMLWLGTGDTPPLHNGGFYVPETILAKGADTWMKIALRDWNDIAL